MSADAFQRAWDYSSVLPEALDRLAKGSVWRVYEQPSVPLRYEVEDRDAPLEVRVIQLRCQRIGNVDPVWVIEARYEDDPSSKWTEVTTGKMVW